MIILQVIPYFRIIRNKIILDNMLHILYYIYINYGGYAMLIELIVIGVWGGAIWTVLL